MSLFWEVAPPRLPPLGSDVHVWGARLDLADQEVAQLERLLSPEERARADRFHHAADRRRFVAAHGMLRTLLGAYLELEPAAITLGTGPHGKPFLDSASPGPALRFNLAHTADTAAVAVAREREVGVDLESADRSFRGDAIAERYFPPSEAAQLRALPEAQRGAAFLRSWVCKEAFAKARGEGLANLDIHTIALSAAGAGPPCLQGVTEQARDTLAGWTLLELPPLYDCPGALVVQGTGWAPRCWLWRGG